MEDHGEGGASQPDEKCYLWLCNVRTWNVWQQVQTQWRTADSGMGQITRTGLDYAGVDAWLRTQPGFRPRARAELMRCLQAMEIACINAWTQQQQENSRN